MERARWLHKQFKESFLKVLVGGCEGFKQDIARPADQTMSAN